MRRFGGDPTVVGKTLGLNGTPHTILGVLPAGFRGLTGQADVFVPVTTQSAADLAEAWNHTYRLVARRKCGCVCANRRMLQHRCSADQVNAQFRMVAGGRERTSARSLGCHSRPLNDERIDPLIRRSVLLMLAAVDRAAADRVRQPREPDAGSRPGARARAGDSSRARRKSSSHRPAADDGEPAPGDRVGAVGGLAVAYGVVSGAAALMPDLRMVLPRESVADNLTRVGLGMLGLDTPDAARSRSSSR